MVLTGKGTKETSHLKPRCPWGRLVFRFKVFLSRRGLLRKGCGGRREGGNGPRERVQKVVLTHGLFQEFVESFGAFMDHDWSVPELESIRLVPPESIRVMEGD